MSCIKNINNKSHWVSIKEVITACFIFPNLFPLDFRVERGDCHGDVCGVFASELSAEAGNAAASSGCLLLPQPPRLCLTHAPRYAAQVSV